MQSYPSQVRFMLARGPATASEIATAMKIGAKRVLLILEDMERHEYVRTTGEPIHSFGGRGKGQSLYELTQQGKAAWLNEPTP
jgi:predicted ArsR family transcriptional regulator